MFSVLFETVFPWLGRFFGAISGIASSDFSIVMDWIAPFGNYRYISCTNLFTGEFFWLDNKLDWLSTLLAPARWLVTEIFSAFGLSHLPFWIAILLFVGSIFICVSIVVFIKNLFT